MQNEERASMVKAFYFACPQDLDYAVEIPVYGSDFL
jgi:hypothetical protein